jgi:predicted  nucleic acid-binding Zn ribbon protein
VKIKIGKWEAELTEIEDGRLDVVLEHADGTPVRDTDDEIADFPELGRRFTTDDLEETRERNELVADAAEGDPGEEHEDECLRDCPACEGLGQRMGALGNKIHFRCRDCGIEFSEDA